jgi:hypothetical protein
MSTKVGEPAPDITGQWNVRVVKRDRKRAGEIYAHKKQRLSIYWAKRRTDEYLRADESWAIEAEVLNAVRAYAITHVGIQVEDGTRLLVPVSLFSAAGKERGVTLQNPTRTSPQRWRVPERLWAIHRPHDDLRDEALIERMHIAGRKGKSVLTTKQTLST